MNPDPKKACAWTSRAADTSRLITGFSRRSLRHIESGQSVMLLASCSFMLHPVISVLRQWGIPFHNPYRKSAGYWNPLRRGRKGSSANRILSLLGPETWTHGDVKLWTEWLNQKGTLRPGARALIEASDDSLPVTTDWLN